MIFRRLCRHRRRPRHRGWFAPAVTNDPWLPAPEVDELWLHRSEGSRWRVVQVAANPHEGTPWLATLELETEFWRPLRGSGITWQLLPDGPEVRFISVHDVPSYIRPERRTP